MTPIKMTVERAKQLQAIYEELPTGEYTKAIEEANAKLEEIYTNFVKTHLVEEKDFKAFMNDAWNTVRDHVSDEPLNYPTAADALGLHSWHVIAWALDGEDE